MDKDEHLKRHLDLCRRMYLRMLADGSWPWKDDGDEPVSPGSQGDDVTVGDTDSDTADSPNSENLVDSDDNHIVA